MPRRKGNEQAAAAYRRRVERRLHTVSVRGCACVYAAMCVNASVPVSFCVHGRVFVCASAQCVCKLCACHRQRKPYLKVRLEPHVP